MRKDHSTPKATETATLDRLVTSDNAQRLVPSYWRRGRSAITIPLEADYKPARGRFTNHTGQRFGRLVALRVIARQITKGGNSAGLMWRCQCDCGSITDVVAASLRDGSTKSCGCLFMDGRRGFEPPNKLSPGESALNQLYCLYKRSAKARGYEFALSKSDFKAITKSNCHYCGALPERKFRAVDGTNGDYLGSGIDRLNNAEGYIYRNVVPCCKQCNYAKNTLTMDEFAAWLLRAHNWALMYSRLGEAPFNLTDREIGGTW